MPVSTCAGLGCIVTVLVMSKQQQKATYRAVNVLKQIPKHEFRSKGHKRDLP